MKIEKIINNNIALVRDFHNNEKVIIGCGIAFNKKLGDEVEPENTDKIFTLSKDSNVEKTMALIEKIPYDYLEVATRVIRQAEKELKTKFREEAFLAIADHICFAVSKVEQDISTQNLLVWEIKKFYQKEYRAAWNALKIIEKYTGILLPEDESTYLALHFVNAQLEQKNSVEFDTMIEFIKTVVRVIESHFSIKLDENSIHYERFIIHVRYFSQRLFENQLSETKENEFYHYLREKFPEIVACVEKINEYLEVIFQVSMTNEEFMYFMMHIDRLISK